MAKNTPARGSQVPDFTRPALAPGLLSAVILMATVALLDNDLYFIVRFIVSILVAIMAVFAVKAEKPLWLIGLVPVVLFYNPIFPLPTWPFTIDPGILFIITMTVPLFLAAAGVFIKVRDETDRRSGGSRR
ncbi:DUF6804 family protein [Mycetocola spongiae]|uniref:DUF6804 family protein n=1 Tax=Mycetocola spongiae TaxID=2859226 RepID=UPI001CF2D763|nr:DUF6804 family protein [Mycetocola spongiae]UCR90093.1 hypothetical protein KXZ72_05355 [Mycetocola spongiae]